MPTVGDRYGLAEYVGARAPQFGLDPAAVMAIAAQEGIGGGIGDAGNSYGPWQLNTAGAAYASFLGVPVNAHLSSGAANARAWSPEGIDFALQTMASRGASGLTGQAAITNIASKFEIPADIPGEIARAIADLANWQHWFGVAQPTAPPVSTPGASVDVKEGQPSGFTPPTGGPGQGPLQLDFGGSAYHVLVSIGLVLLAGVLVLGGIWLLTSSKDLNVPITIARGAERHGHSFGAAAAPEGAAA